MGKYSIIDINNNQILKENLNNICNSKKFDICYTIDENLWKGRKNLQVKLRDLKINSKI